jgi:hypothetical protein
MLSAVTLAALLGGLQTFGGKLYYHTGKRCNNGCVRAYNYQTHAEATSASIVAIAPVEQPKNVHTGAAPADPPDPRERLRKAFYVDKPSITADHVELSRMALAFYNDGGYVGSGLLGFDGGPDGVLQGANAVIRVRAYAGAPQHPGKLDHMQLLWETEHPCWIGRKQSRAISLFPRFCFLKGCPPERVNVTVREAGYDTLSDVIRRHFEEITHLEIVLERLKDR